MFSHSRDLEFLILQYLVEKGFKETAHKLEQESGVFFRMSYFKDMIMAGKWEEVEKYLSCFTKVEDNRNSMNIFFEIGKQKFFEALYKEDRAKALEILVKDSKMFAAFNEDLFKEFTQLLTLDNIRDNAKLSMYGDTKSARGIMLAELKKLIEANPLFCDKLQFPTLEKSRLQTLIDQSLNWQHHGCKNSRPKPDIKTLFVDHSCADDAMVPYLITNRLKRPRSPADTFAAQLEQMLEEESPSELSEKKSDIHSLRLPHNLTASRICGLTYINAGKAILALASNGVVQLWKWQIKASASIAPQLWKPSSGILMTNDISDTNPEDAVPCFALSKTESYLVSASGGKISLFNVATFKTETTFMPPPPAATFLAFYPQDNNIIAIGMDDSSIQIYNLQVHKVIAKLRGHQKRITGLAFSNDLNMLVSSGADSQLCVWSIDGWEKQASTFLKMSNHQLAPPADTFVQFHADQTQFLVIHKTMIVIFGNLGLDFHRQWVPRVDRVITHAAYSCNNELIYVGFKDGTVRVVTSDFQVRSLINPNAYLPPSLRAHPLVIVAHPSEPNQFALGLSDGSVHVIEPSESKGNWETTPLVENAAGPSTASGASGSDQPQQ